MYGWLQRFFQPARRESPAKGALTVDEAAARLPPEEGGEASWEQRGAVNANFYNWAFEARDGFSLREHPLEKKILEALGQLVKSRQPTADMVKRMPGVVPQLMHSLRSGNFSGADLARKISHDMVLVQAVLRMANSSLHNPGQTITSIEHAVLIIGQEGLRQLISSMVFRPIINLRSGRYTRLAAPRVWNQSEQCAIASRMLAPDYNVQPFEAFLAGLIQNIGLIASLSVADKVAAGNGTLCSASFCDALLCHARTLSCNIGREWRFPETVIQAVEEQDAAFETQGLSAAGKVLLLGDYLSKVRILANSGHLAEDRPEIWEGLSGNAVCCYQELKGYKEQEFLAE